MNTLPVDFLTIAVLGALGLWLERIGGKHGLADEFFTPVPLAVAGCVYSALREIAQ